jgi:RNA polymerase sigma-70 factor, ECF subfamily
VRRQSGTCRFGLDRDSLAPIASMDSTTEVLQGQLLGRIAQRDHAALSDLYDATATPLFSVALRIVHDPSDAEEVLQDVFVQIWEKAPTFDRRLGSAFSWVLSITRHRAIDRLRSKQRKARLVEQLVEAGDAEIPAAALPDAGSLDAEQAALVRSAMTTLPKDQRQAIELAFFAGLSHPEIAKTIDQPLGTIKARIRRGLLKMRESLEPKP